MDQQERAEERARASEMVAAVEAAMAATDAKVAGLGAAHAAAAAATGEATSRDGLVRVTVGSAGVPTTLNIDAAAYRKLTADALSRTVLATLQSAAAQVRVATDEIMAPYLANVPQLGDLFPGVPPMESFFPPVPATATEPAARPAPDHDHDLDTDDAHGSVLRDKGSW